MSRRWLRIESLEVRRLMSASPNEPGLGLDAADIPCTCGCCQQVGDALVYQAAGWPGAGDGIEPEVLPAIASEGDSGGAASEPAASLLPLSSLPALSSLPGAFAKLYLNFVGDSTASWGSYAPGTTPAYDLDSNPSTFSSTELTNINEIWSRVAEKYSPFNIDVTTIDPGNINNLQTLRVVIGGNGSWYGSSAGGIAYPNSFSSTNAVTGKNIVFVFSQQLGSGNPRYVAEATAHEAGHAFGLEHQATWDGSTKISEYNQGDSLRAPVMGTSYYAARGLWWQGRSSLPGGPQQNDMSVISGSTNAFGYRTDDHGNTVATATALTPSGLNAFGSGVITTTTDVDYFSFATTPGTVRFTVSPAALGATLDATLELRDSSNNLLVTADTASLGESLFKSVAAGSYRVVVKSRGNYGDVGQYTLVGTLPDAYEDNDTRPSAAFVGNGTGIQLNDLNIDQAGDNDWFRFTLGAPSSVDFAAAFSHASGNLDLEVTDSTGAVLGSSVSFANNELVRLGNLVAGTYYVRVYGFGGATNSYTLGILPGTLPLDLAPPQVTGVTFVGGGTLGQQYSMSAGSGEQLRTVPLGMVDEVRITFSEAVSVHETDLLVTGAHVSTYEIVGFLYDGATRTASWRLNQSIGADVVALRLNATGSTAVVDLVGNRLDGEWDNPLSADDPSSSAFPSGNGSAGGDFYFLATFRPGDADRDNDVDAADYTAWADHFMLAGDWSSGDFNDNGVVDGSDYTIWADHFLDVVPSGASAVSANPPASQPSAEGEPAPTAQPSLSAWSLAAEVATPDSDRIVDQDSSRLSQLSDDLPRNEADPRVDGRNVDFLHGGGFATASVTVAGANSPWVATRSVEPEVDRGASEASRRVAVLDRVFAEENSAHGQSNGERRRVTFAAALARQTNSPLAHVFDPALTTELEDLLVNSASHPLDRFISRSEPT